ncbi:MAG: thioredoxin, partial [Gammaproteobacteria bacterium]
FGVGPVDVPAEAMLKHVQNSEIPVVVDCWAAWCGPCRMMVPEFHKAADAMDTRVRFLKLDTEANQALSAQLGIRSIPCLILYRNGKEVARQAGAMSSVQIQAWVRQASGVA